ncbi:ABC transporter substrate-binding protein [Paenibacillus sp. IHBB 10380]|uniref:ABC transporter substrate-binding protein n=1 Tax=Paenibacillus sp. IHBB 10380 TaxID=1566358 RepID=UPI0005DA167D|nr:ABC transporter substrate-binding protein [Paenibacillus sp. IHBB 10380]AJS60972.1 ferrichrome ABC transporter substrate-binding protein [Paenibacillus sp. IHBB 10380]
MFKWGQKTAWTALLVIVMVGLTACGAKDSNPSEDITPTTENQQPNTTAPEDKVKESATRTVTDEFGEVTIPTHPKRVVGIYVEDYLKALGVTPVVQWYHPRWGKQEYLNLDVPKFDISGSIEALLEQNPDLIIGDGGTDAEKYEQYSKVAPTYRLKENILEDPKEMLKAISSVLGIPEKADSVLSEYDQKVAEGKAKLEQAVGKEKVAVIRLNVADKALALFGIKNRLTGVIYKEFGLEPVDMAANMTDFQAVISKELIPELDADHLIVFPDNGTWNDPENQEAYKALEGPLWKNIPAIKNGNIYKMERSHWQSGAIMANSMKLDDLLKFMVK